MPSAMLLAFAAIVSVAGGLATLISTSADLSGRPLSTWSRPLRTVGAILLFAIGVGTGIGAYFAGSAPHVMLQVSPAATDATPQATMPSAAEDLSSPRQPPPEAVQKTDRPAIATSSVLTEGGKHVPVLEAVGAPRYVIKGNLRASTQAESDLPELQGLLTTKLILNVAIQRTSGQPVRVLELMTRGGGFDKDSGMHQALERMKAALEEEMQKLD